MELQYTRIIMRLLFLIVFIGLNAFSQKINLGDLRGYKNSSLDTLKQEFHVYMEDRLLTVNLNNFKKHITPLTYEEGLSPGNGYLSLPPIRIQDTIYFVSSAGGMVYTIKNDTIKRIDKSFDHGMQYGAQVFEHDDTAFKYGGYGFWSNRDFFTYYDEKQDEWEVYHPINSDITPVGSAFYYSIKNKNLFHVFGGKTVNPNNRRQQLNNDEVWTFDFKNSTWEYRGKHDPIDEPEITISFDSQLILIKKNRMILIDVQGNSKTIYNNSPISAQTNGMRHAVYANGKFYMIIANSTGAYLNIVEEEDFFGPLIQQTKFYKNNNYWFRLIAIYGAVGLIILTILFLIKRNLTNLNKMQLMDNGLKYRNKFREFDKESIAILQLLLSHKEVPSSQVLQLVEKEQYSPAHNERIKVQKINDINLKIATLLGTQDDMITNFKSPQDRRIRLYKISKEHFDLKRLRKLMS